MFCISLVNRQRRVIITYYIKSMVANSMKILLIVTLSYVALSVSAQIPEMRITTQNSQVPGYRNDPGCGGGGGGPGPGGITVSDYVHITNFQLEVLGNPQLNVTKSNQPDSIRRRGNSTMTQTKVPFRLRFGDRTSLFGKEAARSWPLLANHYDNTQILTAIAFELGKRMNLEFTPSFQFVDLYLNNTYRGIYKMTEQVQVNPGRVNIHKSQGWLVEFDFHSPASDKCSTYFRTPQNRYNLPIFIKSPELEDLRDSIEYRFVKNDINQLVELMSSENFPENGYRNLIDLQSYVTYVMIQQLMDNHDFNSQSQAGGLPGSNFAYKDRGGKIKAGPLWDFDLSGGITFGMMMNPQHFTTYSRDIMPLHPFYQRFFDDPVFLARWKKTWDRHQSDLQSIPAFIDSLANLLSPRIPDNFTANNTGGGGWGGGNTIQTEEQYSQRIQTLKTWWNNRVENFGQQIDAMNIDTSLDIEESTPVIFPQIAGSNKIFAIKNGINLQINTSAMVEVFEMNGRNVKIDTFFGPGFHSLSFSHLPKGIYMVRVSFGNEKKIIRLPVI
jgi:hypothetical protein